MSLNSLKTTVGLQTELDLLGHRGCSQNFIFESIHNNKKDYLFQLRTTQKIHISICLKREFLFIYILITKPIVLFEIKLYRLAGLFSLFVLVLPKIVIVFHEFTSAWFPINFPKEYFLFIHISSNLT